MVSRFYAASISPLLLVGMGALILVAGCQTANSAVASKAAGVCPTCKAQTRIMPITGMTYTDHSCPSCRRVSALDETTRAAVERAIGGHAGDTVHVCSRCGTQGNCPICRQERS